MDLNTLWFILIGMLFTGFFLLEGFDYGVGILLPFLGKEDEDRRVILNSIGPFWDGNEVWMIAAGGAMFAAFPHWYATMFSGFYLALVLMLLALILRGVAFEFRSKDQHPGWRNFWDAMIFFGSLVPALLWGIALANLIQGVPIDARKNFVGGFFTLLTPYTLLFGVYMLVLVMLHGAIFLCLKTESTMADQARAAARRLWLPAVALLIAALAASYQVTDAYKASIIPLIGSIALLGSGWNIKDKRDGWAFCMTAITIVTTVATVFLALFPRVMVSTLNPAWSLTIYNASSTSYTLTIMTIVALIFVPIILLYQGWTYWVFRKRVTRQAM